MKIKVSDETAKQLREIAILKGISEEEAAEMTLNRYADIYVRELERARATAERWKGRYDK